MSRVPHPGERGTVHRPEVTRPPSAVAGNGPARGGSPGTAGLLGTERPSRAGRALRIAAPGALLVLTAVHPGYSTDAVSESSRIAGAADWLPLHLSLLAAFAAYLVSLLTWPTAGGGWWRLRRVAVLLGLVCYSAFIGVDGIAGGLLAEAGAHAPPGAAPGLSDAVAELFRAGAVSRLALTGAAGWVLAALTVVVELAADVPLLAAGGLLTAGGLLLAASHDPPIGPSGAGLTLAAAVLLELVQAVRSKSPRVRSPLGG